MLHIFQIFLYETDNQQIKKCIYIHILHISRFQTIFALIFQKQMKRLAKTGILGALLCCLLFSCRQAPTAVVFEQSDDFETLKALAAERQQPLMIFAWKSDNRAARIVRNEVLGDAEVARFFNSHFVNVSAHVSEPQWRWLEQRYGLYAYPHMLLLDAKGRLLGEFSSLGQLGYDEQGDLPCRRPLMRQAALYSRFLSDNDSVFFDEDNWKVMDGCYIRLDSELFRRIVSNRDLLRNRYGSGYDVLLDYNFSSTAVSLFLPGHDRRPRRNDYRIGSYYRALDSLDIDRKGRYRFYADVNLAVVEERYDDVMSLAREARDKGYIQDIEYEDLAARFQ